MANVVLMAFGCFLLYQAFMIGVKKKIKMISCIDNKRFKQVKNVEKLAKDYSNIVILMAIGCFLAAILRNLLGSMGTIIGFLPLIVGVFMLSGFNAKIDDKIKNKVY